ncbi:glycosyltransferase family 4 protein [Candidatus Kaiserbacteria bacterium]|nr:glycosyltransferase family 4 protein [Candidatus Kaiserbacteria bacterium]
MRVLIATGLYPPEVGGPATYSKVLETELPTSGIEVSVLPFSRVRRLPKVIRHVAYFFHALREGKHADVIYAQDPLSVGLPSALAAKILGKKFLLKIVGDYAWEQSVQRFDFTGTPEEFQRAELLLFPQILRAIERFVARRAARIVVPSKYLAKIVAEWGIPKKKLVVIYNGMEELEDAGNKPVLRGLLKFHGKLIVSVGRLVPWKGFRSLIAIFAEMKKDFPDMKLMIIGSGPDLDILETEARQKGVADDVIFTGALPRDVLLRYVRASDVFVLNTRYEGFSHQILEVMMVGVPVVATKVGGNIEAIEHEKSGFLVSPDDARKIKGYVHALLTDPALRTRVIAAARRRVKDFSRERMLLETTRLLKGL